MHNTVKMIKIIFITSLFSIVAACSSGGSGSDEGLDITGTFTGTIPLRFLNADLAFEIRDFNVVATFVQETTGTLGAQTSPIDANINIVGVCVVSIGGGTINFQTNAISLAPGDDFSVIGTATNNTITGSFVSADDDPDDDEGCPTFSAEFSLTR